MNAFQSEMVTVDNPFLSHIIDIDDLTEIDEDDSVNVEEVQQSRREFQKNFHYADGKATSHLKLVGQDYGRMDEIISIIIAQTLGANKHKLLLEALLALGKNSLNYETGKAGWFKASRETLVDYFSACDHSKRDTELASKIRAVTRRINRLKEAQDESGFTLVEHRQMRAPFKKHLNLPSEFRLVLFEYAMEAYYRAKRDPSRYEPTDGRGSKWKNAALEIASEIPRRDTSLLFKRKRVQSPQQILKVIEGYVRKYTTMRSAAGIDDQSILNELAGAFDKGVLRKVSVESIDGQL